MPLFFCRLLPHGVYSLLPTILCSLAWLASLSQDGCDYARVEGRDLISKITGGNNADVPYLEIGFVAYRIPRLLPSGEWHVVYSGACSSYSGLGLEDTFWSIAKGCAFGALVLGGASSLFLWFSTCFVFSRGTWKWAGYQILLACTCQCLAFLWFANTTICRQPQQEAGGDADDIADATTTCTLFYGSIADIVSAVFWFCSALLIFCRYPIPRKIQEPAAPSELTQPTVEVTELPLEGDATATLATDAAVNSNLLQQRQQPLEGTKVPDADII